MFSLSFSIFHWWNIDWRSSCYFYLIYLLFQVVMYTRSHAIDFFFGLSSIVSLFIYGSSYVKFDHHSYIPSESCAFFIYSYISEEWFCTLSAPLIFFTDCIFAELQWLFESWNKINTKCLVIPSDPTFIKEKVKSFCSKIVNTLEKVILKKFK